MTQATNTAINQLEELFTAFNQASSELGERYRDLESQVAVLNRELAKAHSAKLHELSEKERLASRLSALMDALPGGVLVLNEDGVIGEENPAATDILGASFAGRSWNQALRHCASVENLHNGEVTLHDERRISITSRAPDSRGERIILLTDVSENHRLNDLVNREKRLTALGEMSARLAHQVRTPLSSAILYLSHLSSPVPEVDSGEVIGKIFNRLRQIEGLVESMLRFIRGGIGDHAAFSLNEMLCGVRDCMLPQLDAAGARLRLNLPPADCVMHGNREDLVNALLNLVENALQAASRDIEISLREYRDCHLLCVADDGKGIPRELREQIFDPFFSTRANGTGLGLAVVASAVKAHGGEVHIRDGAPRGTVFHLKFPVHRGGGAEEPGPWAQCPAPRDKANADKEQLNG